MRLLAPLAALADRRPRLAALILGILAATGFAPLGLWPIAMLAMGLFGWQISRTPTVRQTAWTGWFFGLGHFTFGNNWIATAFTYQAEMPAVLGWFAVPLLALYLAIFPALAAAGARALGGTGRRWALVPALAACWTLSEMLRAVLFTGYPWNPFAVTLLGPFTRPGLAVLAPWMGTYALSGLAVGAALALVLALSDRRYPAFAGGCAVLLAGMLFPVGKGAEGTQAFTLVQPNIGQDVLNEPEYFEANFVRLAEQTPPRTPGVKRIVLWPESGMADYLRPGYPQRLYNATTTLGNPAAARARIARLIGPDSTLLTGAVDLKITGGRISGAYNSVTALNGQGDIIGSYSKAHLVPYGEYLPMRWLLEPLGISRLVPGAIDFIPGPGPGSIDLGPYGNVGVQICYEIVFSGQTVGHAVRPAFLFNPSNDGWFGHFGPPQHLAQARMRAIEEGLPVLRATTSGISAVIDARGVVRDYLPTGQAGRIDGLVPPAAPPTLFARWGLLLSLGWGIIFLVCGLVATRHRPG
ncbi:apolipoprotein N-acyltransferase [Altererythrobacter xixiisoli]|uniref:Apolipoprotein N-acyltransferase n=1 Tax=Croceibacterium xixiisoli TaxID=1476466 RepID=A0A6I4TZX3_9SPHN|nr:apolipoprotein N-acyltransferase [Croceibacterium xixiisoli]MXP00189.1 apolipoprotein N-acyltransferase [Croceibacterium xixiisoli]